MNVTFASIRSKVSQVDRRLLVAFSAIIGFLAWRASIETVFLINGLLLVFLWLQNGLMRLISPAARSYAVFISFWVASKFLLDYISAETTLAQQFQDALLMGSRLITLALLSFIMTHDATPRKMGFVLSWFSKPFLRADAWKAALTLALMLSAMTRIGRMLRNLNQTLYLRNPSLPIYRRFMLIGLTALRVLAQESESIAIAIASRDLYRPEPWEADR